MCSAYKRNETNRKHALKWMLEHNKSQLGERNWFPSKANERGEALPHYGSILPNNKLCHNLEPFADRKKRHTKENKNGAYDFIKPTAV